MPKSKSRTKQEVVIHKPANLTTTSVLKFSKAFKGQPPSKLVTTANGIIHFIVRTKVPPVVGYFADRIAGGYLGF